MSYLMRIFWLISLLFFVSGCSGYKVACCFDSDISDENLQDIRDRCDLKIGNSIRLNLVDGTQADGVVHSFSSREITLAAKGENLKPRSYPTAEILSVEKETSYTAYKTAALILILTGIIVGGAMAISNTDVGWGTDVDLVSFGGD